MSKVLPTEKNFLMSFRKNVKLTSVEFMEVRMMKVIYKITINFIRDIGGSISLYISRFGSIMTWTKVVT
jgi:hypothetical protein